MPFLFGFIGVSIASAWSALCYGVTLSILWGWFIVVMFELPEIGVAQAYGLCLVASMLKGVRFGKEDDGLSALVAKTIFVLPLVCAMTLVFGYVAKGFV